MRLDHIVCLANSYKHDNRCVAGISLVTMQWVRLIGRKVPGCMTRDEARYPDGSTPSLLDVFECELGDECGSRHHPEDICVTARPWRRIRRFGETGDIQALTGALATENRRSCMTMATELTFKPFRTRQRAIRLSCWSQMICGGGYGRRKASAGIAQVFVLGWMDAFATICLSQIRHGLICFICFPQESIHTQPWETGGLRRHYSQRA